MPIEVTITEEKVKLSTEGQRRWSELAGAKNVDQMKAGLDGEGQPLPPGVTLRRSGALEDTVQADPEGYAFTVPYAEELDARFHFVGLSDGSLEELEPAMTEVGDAEFYIEETEG